MEEKAVKSSHVERYRIVYNIFFLFYTVLSRNSVCICTLLHQILPGTDYSVKTTVSLFYYLITYAVEVRAGEPAVDCGGSEGDCKSAVAVAGLHHRLPHLGVRPPRPPFRLRHHTGWVGSSVFNKKCIIFKNRFFRFSPPPICQEFVRFFEYRIKIRIIIPAGFVLVLSLLQLANFCVLSFFMIVVFSYYQVSIIN